MPRFAIRFETARLEVLPWRTPGEDADLAGFLEVLLDDEVTRWLPRSWQGPFPRERTLRWIERRDAEGTILRVLAKDSREPVGLLTLYGSVCAEGSAELRIGYLLARAAWGRGLASELVEGLVAWCRAQCGPGRLVAHVTPANLASRRVLEKSGFRLVCEAGASAGAMIELELLLS